ncbi:TetR family transcriptional regulator [Microbacterium sp. NPDC096154]|uniref:TetR family transcriptional regulator n=1 Tax=Microbacterium sp. NPDC096154 TaxID=3155549 RepID=UPI00331EBDAD
MDVRDTRRERSDTERHTRDGIVDAALTLLSEVGLPDLSMRRLAGALGVQPSALYWHFDNKQSLLAAVADRIVAAARPVARASSGADEVATVALSLREALLAHRDGAEVVLSTHALGLGSDAAHQRLVTALSPTPDARTRTAATVLLQFIFGHASLVQQRIQAARYGAYAGDEAEVAAETAADFTAGIRMILSGLGQERTSS